MLRVKEMSTMLLVPKILNLLVLNNGTLTKRNKENVEVDIANICCINMGGLSEYCKSDELRRTR
jgi:hypothetical protein